MLKKITKNILLMCVGGAFVGFGSLAYAQVMQSTTYKLQEDSVNFGGARSSSPSYSAEDTAGEIATGYSGSTNYKLHAGYQQMQEVYLSMSTPADVSLSPNIGGITGGTSNGSTAVTVITDNPAGYSLSIKATSSPALVSGANSFADYVPSGADPDYAFSVAGNTSAFAFSPEGADIVQAYKDNGAGCNIGGGDTADKCWDGLSMANKLVAQRTSPNYPTGTVTTIKFRAESGGAHLQMAGLYMATSTITALAL